MSAAGPADTGPAREGRLASLDVFRGLVVAAMLLVNAPGVSAPGYVLLAHMPWHGWTPTDLIFPSFLFILGAAVPFSFGKRLERGGRPASLALQAAKRAAILIAMGLVGGIPVDADGYLRIPGVLQRIGLCYLIAAGVFLAGGLRACATAAAAILAGYWLALTHVPVPGYGPGDLSPAGNLASFVDRAVLGPRMANAVYDAEGLLGTFPAAATTLLGVLAGAWLRSGRPARAKAAALAAAGAALFAAGQAWGRTLPINKHIYTSSFAVLSGGAAALLLAALYYAVDLRGARRWSGPFRTFGVHALLAYCGSSLAEALLDQGAFGDPPVSLRNHLRVTMFGWLSPPGSSLAWSLGWVLLWYAVVRAVDRLALRRARAASPG